MVITDISQLETMIELTEEERTWKEDGPSTLPLLISDHMAKLIANPAIRRQFVPSSRENTDDIGTLDPQEEKKHEGTERLIHRYTNRAAFLTTDRCFSYCRHCFRRRFTGSMTGPASDEDIRKAAEYLAKHTEIREVLLTGGDLFTLSDERLGKLLSSFKAARPDIILRLCTRAVAVQPDRFTEDLFNVIRENQTGAPYYLMTQFNHPDELTEEAMHAVEGFLSLGIPAMNQTVLLKGVNDDAETLIKLCNDLLMHRIKPYYLFQGDLVKGTAHLRASIRKGLEIDRILRRELSGLALPQYTIDLPEGGGKVALTDNHILAFENGIYAIGTPDGDIRHYPESESEA